MSFAHMRPAGVRTAMQALSQRATELDQGWQQDKSVIAGAESGIGGDVLGQAFRSVYTAPGQAARTAADRIGPAMAEDAQIGVRCAEDYLNADSASAAAMPTGGGAGADPGALG
ncbi:hypothetical protein N8J89_25765 [Crossiella sp. CA-258035]|uniref:hypothetical protein n=1 Tax=Crossiella sp. CA-258035 TaxID=2981138 RepID=UPI0024BCC0EA|nr:hypothetical protein [Crossiella sp. CA-258035]WHT16534.1 hypothetical protein N8J89_25765 [Crossiella sp. CA-258035]